MSRRGNRLNCQRRAAIVRRRRADSRATPRTASVRRSGLAPLELVLTLPMLMMILAMMIIVGTAGSWKVRTLANSRQAAFRAVWPRTGGGDPKPDNWWPASASIYAHNRGLSPFPTDPFAQHVAVRGPVVGDPASGRSLRVYNDTLDMREEILSGYAEVDRDLPLWQRLPWRNHYLRDTQMYAGNQWQHGAMRISNDSRRILITYEYDLARFAPNEFQQVMQSAHMLLSNPDRPVLFTLDRDDELRSFYGPPYTPYDHGSQYRRPSVYPWVGVGCDFDLRSRVEALLPRIEQVPCNLSRLFRNMYQQQLNALPPNDPGRAVLQQKIQELDDFMGTLPNCR